MLHAHASMRHGTGHICQNLCVSVADVAYRTIASFRTHTTSCAWPCHAPSGMQLIEERCIRASSQVLHVHDVHALLRHLDALAVQLQARPALQHPCTMHAFRLTFLRGCFRPLLL